ncbi:MAG: hypothetical protein IJ179_01285 [Oscillospiraceae bacterium]|nr:hypothetical protein [Oscillospiraceae bacterium]
MITENNERAYNPNVNVGLPVFYDGDVNQVMFYDQLLDYPVGGMIAEYARLDAKEIKGIIMECSHLDDEPTDENLAAFMDDFQDLMQKRLAPVAGTMALVEIFSVVEEWIKAEMTGRDDEYLEALKQIANYEDVIDYIFADTAYGELGKKTVCQMMLTAYATFVTSFVNTVYTFDQVIKWADQEEADENAMHTLAALFTDMGSMQHIDFRILNIDGKGFQSLYTIQTSMSLLTFEMAHWMGKGVSFVKCANCGHYFIPEGRSDTIYCNYPTKQNPEKTCREIGAQIRRANKEKNDITTREYRKIYMRYKMLTRRHPENRDAAKKFDILTDNITAWRKKLADGTATTDEFLAWLSEF